MASNLDIDERRWYIISTSVYKLDDGYVGITGPSTLKSESIVWLDCNELCFAEYEPVYGFTYKPKNFISPINKIKKV